jgi:hypothetical protein
MVSGMCSNPEPPDMSDMPLAATDYAAFLICVQDVTERKLAEQELRRINSYLEEG